ncbi:coiled-coil protein [Legionella steigerwaltii]|uniref:Coiled-coil protein n=1 Tax=Legionella steigerwaltii TaxID=460 RepID=A0A378L452_9GAMM|nr:hypothetical protein [Legionella steigerwaltii]KTD77063.1 coiled-coil protein [Legionella steigerwaltii]STY21554.1 coiled-coil protein [Legionella steigerwaltii]
MFFKTDIETFEHLEADSVEHLRKKLNSMKGIKAPKKSIALSILRMLPFASGLIDSLAGAGGAINRLVEIEGVVNEATAAASEGFQIIKVLTGISDFIVIPIIYFGAYITNQKVPFTLSRNARFLYAAVILGLTITALAFPPSAPIIALVSSIAALGLSIITLAKLYYKRYEIEDQLAEIKEQINVGKNRLNALIDYLEKLEANAKKAKEEGKIEEYNSLEAEIEGERRNIKEQLNSLQELHNNQVHCEQKLEKLGATAVLDKSAGIAFASLILIGAVASLIVPPVGVGIIAVTAALAVAYTVGRLIYPLLKFLANKIVNYVTRKSESDTEEGEALKEKDSLTESESESSAKKAKKDMPEVAKRLENAIEDDPKTKTEYSTQTFISGKRVSKKNKDDEEIEQDSENPKNLMQ